tara:strand:+ start:866 stop:1180 length:315 start_codon:yes stop_codon:yes gene_type:complete
MKITKQRLKEIIREELSTVRESESHEPYDAPWDTEAEDSPFSAYDLEAENEKGRLATAEKVDPTVLQALTKALLNTNLDPKDATTWEMIKDAFKNAGPIFPPTE